MMRAELYFTERQIEEIVEHYLNTVRRYGIDASHDDVEVYNIRQCGPQANPDSEYIVSIHPRKKDAD